MVSNIARLCRAWVSREITEQLKKQELLISYGMLGADAIFAFHYRGREVRMHLPEGAWDTVQSSLLLNRSFYEQEVLEGISSAFDLGGAVVLDAGANIGNHSVYFSMFGQAERVIAFEANPYAAGIARRNFELNGVVGEVVAKGLWDRETTISFDRYTGINLGGSSYMEDSRDGLPAVMIDTLNLPRLDFLKVDVEGSAPKVIAGAMDTLSRHKPTLMLELDASEAPAVLPMLQKLGYSRTASMPGSNYMFEPL